MGWSSLQHPSTMRLKSSSGRAIPASFQCSGIHGSVQPARCIPSRLHASQTAGGSCPAWPGTHAHLHVSMPLLMSMAMFISWMARITLAFMFGHGIVSSLASRLDGALAQSLINRSSCNSRPLAQCFLCTCQNRSPSFALIGPVPAPSCDYSATFSLFGVSEARGFLWLSD